MAKREWIGKIEKVTAGDAGVNIFAGIDFAHGVVHDFKGDWTESNAYTWKVSEWDGAVAKITEAAPKPVPDGYCRCGQSLRQYVLDVEGEVYVEWLCHRCDFTHGGTDRVQVGEHHSSQMSIDTDGYIMNVISKTDDNNIYWMAIVDGDKVAIHSSNAVGGFPIWVGHVAQGEHVNINQADVSIRVANIGR